MAAPTNTVRSGAVVGKKESVVDQLFRVQNDDTPVFNLVNSGSRTTGNTLHQWQTDAVRAGGANARLEGDDFTPVSATPTVNLVNYTQIFADGFTISDTTEKLDVYGRANEKARLLKNTRQALMYDCEHVLTHDQVPQQESGSNPRQMRTIPGWISTNAQLGSGGTAGTSSAARTAGTARALTETMLNNATNTNGASGGFAKEVFTNIDQKLVIDGFTGGAERKIDVLTEKRVQNVDVYKTHSGAYSIRINYKMPQDIVLGIDPRYWKAVYLRKWELKELAKTGAAQKWMIDAEWTLESCNEVASFLIGDLS